ncbi:GNAT family N-acetyltransferase [Methanosphaera sp. WGK6]|uniref:GNAT family N-acetyltransferase n=1 Tax=Methanosphaera sp. WGK6 TaxID=1561964 RepID=UPI0013016C6F|nr:GNAT family N-acetyltransferase [Methanosphaera sp. WGK6]
MDKYIKTNYHRISKDYEYELIQSKNKSLNKQLIIEMVNDLRKSNYETYMILCDYDIIGFFTLCIDNYEFVPKIQCNVLKIICLYIYEPYRLRGIGTEVLNDIIWSIKNTDCNCVLVNSFVDSAMFFLKNGFDFYKRSYMDYKNKYNIITLYKKLK